MKHLILFLLIMLSFTSCWEDDGSSVVTRPTNKERKSIKRPVKAKKDSIKSDSTTITIKDVVIEEPKKEKEKEDDITVEYTPLDINSNPHYYDCDHKELIQFLLEGALQRMLKRSHRPVQAFTEWELSLYNLQYTHPKISKRLEKIVEDELNYIMNTIRLDLNAIVDEDPKKDYIYLKKSKK